MHQECDSLYLHRLHRQGNPKHHARYDIEEAREDQRRRKRNGPVHGESDHKREERAQIAERPRDLSQRGASDGSDIIAVETLDVHEKIHSYDRVLPYLQVWI